MQYDTRIQPVLFLEIGLMAPYTVSLRLIGNSVLRSRDNNARALQRDDELLDLGRDECGRSAGKLLMKLLGGKVGQEVGECGS